MLNSVSVSISYNNQDILRPKNTQTQKTEHHDAKTESKLSPKASAIAEQIKSGNYKIDLNACANAIADGLV